MKGIIRITQIRLPNYKQILYELLTALPPYQILTFKRVMTVF